MAKYYYNGVLLPEIPAEVLTEYPYCVIYRHASGEVRLLAAPKLWYRYGNALYITECTYGLYVLSEDSNNFVLRATYTNTGGWGYDGGIVWSNHNIPDGAATASAIYYYASSAYPNLVFEDYTIKKDSLTAIGDQVRRIYKTEDKMTLEQMTLNLSNVISASDLPSAEESGFGNDSNMGCGIVSEGTAGTATTKSMTLGYVFTASEAFSIIGLRHKQANYAQLKLWDSSGNVVTTISAPGVSEWENHYFDTPINVAIGETYTVTAYCYQPTVVAKSNTTFNNKLTGIELRYSARVDTFPTTTGGTSSVACVDIIIAPVAAELPDTYQVQRTTMDDIAEEVQRITGAETKLNTTQIITALQNLSFTLQSKTVTPTTEAQTITPDEGYYGLSSVTVEAAAAVENLQDLSEVPF